MKIRIYTDEQLNLFPIYIMTINLNHKQEYVKRENGYKDDQLFLVSSGSGILNINNETYLLSENDLFYIAANTPHEYYGTDESFTTTFLSFSGNGFEAIKKYYSLSEYGVYKNKNRGSFETSVKKLYDSTNSTMDMPLLCALTFSTVTAFFDDVCKKEYSPIETVYSYLEMNFSSLITLEDALSVFPYSKAKLCRDFKAAYNCSIFEKLTEIRLAHADIMLKNNPHLKLKNISVACGFNDVSYFCKMYKKYYSHSPKGGTQ